MKYLRLASVAALVSAATVSAGPLGAREHDGYCPKGYTMSVYYKTVAVEPTVTPTSTPVTVESQPSAEPTVPSSSTAIVVVSTTPVAVVQVETTTPSASAAETSAAKTSAAVASAAETSAPAAAVVKTAPVVAPLPTSSAETVAVIKTIPVPAVETTTAQTTAQAPVKASSTSTPQATVEAVSTAASSATSASSTEAVSNKAVSAISSSAFDGTATFYGGNVDGGTCSFSGYTIPSGLFGTALSLDRWDNAAECGACVSVTGPNGNSIKAMIVDQCPECESNHLDLFQDAFAELSDISAGVISTTWSYVSCDLDGALKLKNKEGTSAYWFSMQVVNANEAVTALEVSTDGGSTWQSTTRTYYNFFENTSGFGTSTVDVRVTGASGKTLVVKSVGVSSGNEVTAASNLV